MFVDLSICFATFGFVMSVFGSFWLDLLTIENDSEKMTINIFRNCFHNNETNEIFCTRNSIGTGDVCMCHLCCTFIQFVTSDMVSTLLMFLTFMSFGMYVNGIVSMSMYKCYGRIPQLLFGTISIYIEGFEFCDICANLYFLQDCF